MSSTAERAWNQPENRDRNEPAPEFDGGLEDIPSRGSTPAGTREDISKIHLTFDKKPKNLEKKFVFEFNSQKCDVLLSGFVAEFSC